MYKYIEYKCEEGIAWVYINRPEQRNALCKDALFELIDIFQRIDDDEDVRVAVLTGKGKTFVSGADVTEMADMNPFEYMKFGNIYTVLNKLIRENSKPVIGAVNGHAIGGGNVLVLSADMIIASENAKFALPEIHLGIFGGAAIMPSIVGKYKAAELILLGEAYTAQQAHEMGIVNRVVPLEELIDTVTEIANKIKEKSPLAVKMAKKAILGGVFYDINTATDFQLPLMSMLYGSHDQKEGMSAMLEKRKAVFNGK